MTRIALTAVAMSWVLVAAPAGARRVEVALDGAGKILVVDASINQQVTGRFIVDTGATYCVIDKEVARDVSLSGRKDGQKIRVATANGMVEATLGEARRIDVGDAVAREVPVAVLEEPPLPGFLGIIGLSFLQRFKYSVDSERGVLRLEN